MRSFRLSDPSGREATPTGWLLAVLSLAVGIWAGYLWVVAAPRVVGILILFPLLATPLVVGVLGGVFHLFVGILLGWIGWPVWKPRPDPSSPAPARLPSDQDGAGHASGSDG